MEADQNQEVPEVQAVMTECPAPDQPKSEEVNEAPLVQDPPQPEESPVEPPVEASAAEVESEKPPEVEPAQEKTETPKESENVAAAEQVEVEKRAEEKSENEAVAPEKEPGTAEKPVEQKVEPVEAPKEEAAPAKEEAVIANESQAEPEKPSDAPQVQAEPPKQVETQPKEVGLPMFYGWFLLSEDEERIKCSTMDFLKTLDTLEAFKKHISEFTGEPDKEVDLEQYFQTQAPLHCTTKYCDYGKAEGSKEYSEQQVVKDAADTSTELSVTSLIVTPRTFGARVALTAEQLPLWPAGADKEGVPEADLSGVEALEAGSRAHVTLGCAPKVEAVQTGLDLLEILVLLKGEKAVLATEELELGTLSYLGQGRWYLALREAVTCDATFSSFSEKERPAQPGKKEGGEKKKKPKCAIL